MSNTTRDKAKKESLEEVKTEREKTKATIVRFTKQLRNMNNVLDELKPIYFEFSELNEDLSEDETESLLGAAKFKELKTEMERLSSVDWL